MTAANVEIDASKLMRANYTITVTVRRLWLFRLRLWLALRAFRIGAWVLGDNVTVQVRQVDGSFTRYERHPN